MPKKDPLIFFVFALPAGVIAIIFGFLVLIFDHAIWLFLTGEVVAGVSLFWIWGYERGVKDGIHAGPPKHEPIILDLEKTDHIDTHM